MSGPETVWFCYMLRCSDGSFYVGIAIDVEDRVKRHNWGVGTNCTAKRRPVKLIWQERCRSSEAARAREKEIKGWSRKKKIERLLLSERGKTFAQKQGSGERGVVQRLGLRSPKPGMGVRIPPPLPGFRRTRTT